MTSNENAIISVMIDESSLWYADAGLHKCSSVYLVWVLGPFFYWLLCRLFLWKNVSIVHECSTSKSGIVQKIWKLVPSLSHPLLKFTPHFPVHLQCLPQPPPPLSGPHKKLSTHSVPLLGLGLCTVSGRQWTKVLARV